MSGEKKRNQDPHAFFDKQLLRWASHGIEQYVELGLKRIHLLHEPQSTRYGSN